MYEELGRVKEPVALSPGEALSSAEALLVRQGYEVTRRTETALTVVRRKREGMLGHSFPNLTVAVRALPEGGLEIKLHGNDREGVQARQAELASWAEGLPKVGAGQQDREQEAAQGPAKGGTEEVRPQRLPAEAGEGHRAENVPVGDDPKGEPNPGTIRRSEMPTEAGVDSEGTRSTPEGAGGWAAGASWDRRPPVAAGKEDEEPTPPLDRTRGAGAPHGIDASEQRDAPQSTRKEKAAGSMPARRSDQSPRSPDAPPRGKAAPEPMDYEYKMIQIPPTISVQANQHKGNEAAQYMEAIANSHSEQGWEFFRVDTLSVSIPPGCLAALFGDKGSQNQYYVMTFRRTRS